MYTREQIIAEIRRIAATKGTQSLDQGDFELNSMIPMSTVRYYLGTWKLALTEAGLGAIVGSDTVIKAVPENEDELLTDLIRLNNETGEIPTPALIDTRGKYYLRHYLERWKSISEAYLLAQKKFPPQPSSYQQFMDAFPNPPFTDPEELFAQPIETPVLKTTTPHKEISESLRLMTEPLFSTAEAPIESLETPAHEEFIENHFFFRGLRNGPVNKMGVIYLFATIHQELGYYINSLQPGYPDCIGERCVDRPNNLWEQVNIHFEYKSSDFKRQNHGECLGDVVVCWRHDWPECPKEVLELRTAIKQLPAR